MLEVPVYNPAGEQIDTLRVDEALFGGEVNAALLKQAVVAYHARRRQGSARTRGRSEVHGSTRKLYRQKGTGLARRGAVRTPVVRGGGVAFAKRPPARHTLPRKMRRAALNAAVLAKMIGHDLMVLDGLDLAEPRTRQMARVLANLNIRRSCLLATAERDRNVHLSCRNLRDLTVRTAEELNAFDVATRQKMLVTSAAMKRLMGREAAE
jgi:large subunit ribosomal protein L4